MCMKTKTGFEAVVVLQSVQRPPNSKIRIIVEFFFPLTPNLTGVEDHWEHFQE